MRWNLVRRGCWRVNDVMAEREDFVLGARNRVEIPRECAEVIRWRGYAEGIHIPERSGP